jgi:hypothetical protein
MGRALPIIVAMLVMMVIMAVVMMVLVMVIMGMLVVVPFDVRFALAAAAYRTH